MCRCQRNMSHVTQSHISSIPIALRAWLYFLSLFVHLFKSISLATDAVTFYRQRTFDDFNNGVTSIYLVFVFSIERALGKY